MKKSEALSILQPLSKREREIAIAIGHGTRPGEMAKQLGLSTKTIHTYRSRIMKKLKIHSNAQLFYIVHAARLAKIDVPAAPAP